MPSSSYQPLPSSAEEYLQRLMRQGFLAAAAIAHLFREVHEGYVDTDIPIGAYISWPDPDGCFFVETAAGPPVSARNYRCRERSHAERLEYLHERDRRRALGGAGRAPSRAVQDVEPSGEQPAAAPGVKAPEVANEEVPKPAPMAAAAEEPLKAEPAKPMSGAPADAVSNEPDEDGAAKWLALLLVKKPKPKKKTHKVKCMELL